MAEMEKTLEEYRRLLPAAEKYSLTLFPYG